MQDTKQAGAALQAALNRRGCALSADEARTLAVSLRDLVAEGLLVPCETPCRLPDPSPGSQPDSAPRSGVLGCGTRAGGAELPSRSQTAPAYNMGQSVYITRGKK